MRFLFLVLLSLGIAGQAWAGECETRLAGRKLAFSTNVRTALFEFRLQRVLPEEIVFTWNEKGGLERLSLDGVEWSERTGVQIEQVNASEVEEMILAVYKLKLPGVPGDFYLNVKKFPWEEEPSWVGFFDGSLDLLATFERPRLKSYLKSKAASRGELVLLGNVPAFYALDSARSQLQQETVRLEIRKGPGSDDLQIWIEGQEYSAPKGYVVVREEPPRGEGSFAIRKLDETGQLRTLYRILRSTAPGTAAGGAFVQVRHASGRWYFKDGMY